MTDHRYTFLVFWPSGTAELELGDGDLEIEESVSLAELTTPGVVSLKSFIQQKSKIEAQTERIKMLGETMISLLKPLKHAAVSEFEDSFRSGETRRGFQC